MRSLATISPEQQESERYVQTVHVDMPPCMYRVYIIPASHRVQQTVSLTPSEGAAACTRLLHCSVSSYDKNGTVCDINYLYGVNLIQFGKGRCAEDKSI